MNDVKIFLVICPIYFCLIFEVKRRVLLRLGIKFFISLKKLFWFLRPNHDVIKFSTSSMPGYETRNTF